MGRGTVALTSRGRPRSVEADHAIVAATLDLLAEEGMNALSVEAVAARAGVGKSTIYRRWASKEVLVEDALSSLNDDLPAVPTEGSTRERLVAMVEQIRCRQLATNTGRIMPRMVAYGSSHPELFASFYRRVIEPRRERFREVLRDGVAAGVLREDLDLELAVTLLVAPMIYLNMMRGGAGAPAAGTSEAIVDTVLAGIGAATAPASS